MRERVPRRALSLATPAGENPAPVLLARQLELADWLAVNRKTIGRWMSGEDEPRAVMWTELLEITQERHAQLAELIKAIAERAEKA